MPCVLVSIGKIEKLSLILILSHFIFVAIFTPHPVEANSISWFLMRIGETKIFQIICQIISIWFNNFNTGIASYLVTSY